MATTIQAGAISSAADPRYFYWVEELLDSRTGSPFQSGGTRKYTRKWRVKVKDRNLGANVVCRAPGVVPYAPYATEDGKEWDYQALCTDIHLEDPEDKLDGTHRIVVAEYSTEMPAGGPPRFVGFGADPQGAQNQPWLEPPEIEWDGEVVREAVPYDLNNKPYLNAAKQPFKPAPTVEMGRTILIYQRNEPSHNARRQVRYSFCVNSDVFLGEEPGTVKCMPPRAILKWRGTVSYWRVTYKFVFNNPEPPLPYNTVRTTGGAVLSGAGADGAAVEGVAAALRTKLRTWQPQLLNCGMMQLQNIFPLGPNFNLPVPIFRHGGPVTEPVLLDEFGRELKPDGDGKMIPNYIQFRQYLALPLTPLLVSGIGFPE